MLDDEADLIRVSRTALCGLVEVDETTVNYRTRNNPPSSGTAFMVANTVPHLDQPQLPTGQGLRSPIASARAFLYAASVMLLL